MSLSRRIQLLLAALALLAAAESAATIHPDTSRLVDARRGGQTQHSNTVQN